jgi:hypothetical protein
VFEDKIKPGTAGMSSCGNTTNNTCTQWKQLWDIAHAIQTFLACHASHEAESSLPALPWQQL